MSLLRTLLIPFTFPLSLVYGSIIWIRNKLYDLDWVPSSAFDIPIISVGNITTGGSGKTPLVMYLADLLQKNGKNPGIVSRGYGRNSQGMVTVHNGKELITNVENSGDEPYLMASALETVPVVVCENRCEGISQLITKNSIKLAVGGSDPMEIECNICINSAGHGATKVASLIKGIPKETVPQMILARGCYFVLPSKKPFTRMIYPLPDEHDVAVHVSPDMSGMIRFGPDTEFVNEVDYTVNPDKAPFFYEAARRFWPEIKKGDLEPGYAGVRPKLSRARVGNSDFTIQDSKIHGVKGAITADYNSVESIMNASEQLLRMLIDRNKIAQEDVAAVFFTTSPDLNAEFPARSAREIFGWNNVPLMCSHEMSKEGALEKCIRILILWNTEIKQNKYHPKSDFIQILREMRIPEMRFSKYCMGILHIYKKIKYNRFKPKLTQINKILTK